MKRREIRAMWNSPFSHSPDYLVATQTLAKSDDVYKPALSDVWLYDRCVHPIEPAKPFGVASRHCLPLQQEFLDSLKLRNTKSCRQFAHSIVVAQSLVLEPRSHFGAALITQAAAK